MMVACCQTRARTFCLVNSNPAHTCNIRPRTESVVTKSAPASMPCPFPPEILNLIVDHLHTEPTTLNACCVVSKPWIHRTRTHLFARIKFDTTNSDIERWKKAFPDSSSSPAHHTRHLLVRGLSAVTAADAGGWIRAFHNLVHLQLEGVGGGERVSLIPFHGLSIIAHPQITQSDLHLPRCFGPYLFLSPSRGSRVSFSQPGESHTEHAFDLAQTHRIP